MLNYYEYCQHYGLNPKNDVSFELWQDYRNRVFGRMPTWLRVVVTIMIAVVVAGLLLYPAVP